MESITERLSLYTRLDNSETEEELQQMREELTDRFGPIPHQVEDLFITVRCRKLAVDLGFEKMLLKNNSLKCYLSTGPILLILNQKHSNVSSLISKPKQIKQG